MATNSPRECSICSEDFNEEERCPRSLPCSHSICTECIQNLIDRNNKKCPFCLRGFNASSARDIGLNTGLLDVLKLLKEMEQKVYSPQKGPQVSTSDWREEFKKENEEKAKQNISRCREAKCSVDSVIRTNNEIINSLSQVNHVIENEIIVKLNQTVTKNKKRMKLLDEQNTTLENQKKIMNEKEKTMEEALRKLSASNATSKAASLFDEVESMNLKAKTWLQSLEGHLLELQNSHQKMKQEAKSTEESIKNIQKELKSHAEVEEEVAELIPSFPLMTIQDIIPQQVTIEMLREKREPVMELIRQGKVYAVQHLEGKQRHAKISVDEKNRICIHHLDENGVSPNVHLLQHSEITSLVNSSSRLTFLELSDANKHILGRMYIRLTPDSKRATQFSILCTGVRGSTYTGSNINKVNGKGSDSENVWFGGSMLLEGNGRKALVPGALEEIGGMFMRPRLMGSVQGWPNYPGYSIAAQFYVITKTIPGSELDCCFGMVEEGLNVLTDVIKTQPNIKNVVISDSGIVLPR